MADANALKAKLNAMESSQKLAHQRKARAVAKKSGPLMITQGTNDFALMEQQWPDYGDEALPGGQELKMPEQETQLKMMVRSQQNRIDSLESRVSKLEGDNGKLWQ